MYYNKDNSTMYIFLFGIFMYITFFQKQNDKHEFTNFNKSTRGSLLYRRQDIKHKNTSTYFSYFTKYYGTL